ncbi:YfhO family protein [Patescibacteria group bacterium]|nr:YfhO family protein [Patescibacteria group bacterium]
MSKNKKALLLILSFILLIFIKNIAFWSKEQTFIFGDTAIYALQLSAFSQNITSIFSPHSSFLLWNPNYLSTGMPTLAIIDLGYLYPPNFFIALLAKILGNPLLVFPFTSLLVFLHLGFGGYFIYKILKEHWKLDEFSSLIGGFLWLFIGFNLEYTAATSVLFAASYLPVCFYLNQKYRESNKLKHFFLFYLLLSFSFLAGYPMPSIIIFLICIVYNILNKVGPAFKKELTRITMEHIKGFFLITLPIISPLYLTVISNFSNSVRGSTLTLEGFLSNTSLASNLVESLLPLNTPFNATSAVNIIHIYISVVAIVILLQAKDKILILKDKRNLVILILGIAGTILALGKLTYMPTLIYLTTPLISLFRRLAIFSLLPGFSICILVPQLLKSAQTQKELSKSLIFGIKFIAILLISTQVARVLYHNGIAPIDYNGLLISLSLVFIIGILSILSLLLFTHHQKTARILLVFALLIEAGTLVSGKVGLNSKTNPKNVFAPNELTRYVQKIIKPSERAEMSETQHNYSTDYLKIEQTAGYVSLASEYGVRINEALNYKGEDYNTKNLRDILGVKYVVRKGDDDNSALTKVVEIKQNPLKPNFYSYNYKTSSWELDPIGTYYNIYENPTALPRLYLASDIIITTEQSKYLLGYMGNLENPKTVFIKDSDIEKHEISSEGVVEMLDYKRNYIKAAVKSDNPTFLANSTGYYSGWSVKVNGKKTEIIQTNWFMMGVYVPKGENIVEFTYTPHKANIGLLYITIAAIYWFFFKVLIDKHG